MSDYENRRTSARQSIRRAQGGGGKATYWILGIAVAFVLSVILFSGGDTASPDGPESVADPVDTPVPEVNAPGLAPPAPQ